MKFGIVVFPGTNCERDTAAAVEIAGGQAELVWHADDSPLQRFDGLILPGGFAHGDALRAGAIARFSAVMPRVMELAQTGRPVVGICNGFQVLVECGLLPGALLRNDSLQFRAEWVHCRVEVSAPPLTEGIPVGTLLYMPVAHGMGNYCEDERSPLGGETLVALRYCDANGDAAAAANPNGSAGNIAGIVRGNVFGLMPHPERAVSPLLGSVDGLALFKSLTRSLVAA